MRFLELLWLFYKIHAVYVVLYRAYPATAGALWGVLWQIILGLLFNAARSACCLSSLGHMENPQIWYKTAASVSCSKKGAILGRSSRKKVFVAGGDFEKC